MGYSRDSLHHRQRHDPTPTSITGRTGAATNTEYESRMISGLGGHASTYQYEHTVQRMRQVCGQSLGATDSNQSSVSHALPCQAGAQNLLCLLEPIPV